MVEDINKKKKTEDDKKIKVVDNNSNGIPDHIETIGNYIFALIVVAIGAFGYFRFGMTEGTLKWILGFGFSLTGGRSIVKDFLMRR